MKKLECPKCHSPKVYSYDNQGLYHTDNEESIERMGGYPYVDNAIIISFQCKDCGCQFSEELNVVLEVPRIVTLYKVRKDCIDEGYAVPVGSGYISDGIFEGRWVGDDKEFQIFYRQAWETAESSDFEEYAVNTSDKTELVNPLTEILSKLEEARNYIKEVQSDIGLEDNGILDEINEVLRVCGGMVVKISKYFKNRNNGNKN